MLTNAADEYGFEAPLIRNGDEDKTQLPLLIIIDELDTLIAR